MYGFADTPELDSAQHLLPSGAFLLARAPGVKSPVGCGGFRTYPQREYVAEIRRMYVVPTWRGQGLGQLMLTRLEGLAASAGAREAILETGSLNTAALRLYELAGYQRTAPYVPGRLDINRAFAKPLVAQSGELSRPA